MNRKIILLIIFCLNSFLAVNAHYIFTLQVSSKKIGYDQKRKCIYATINGEDPNYANSLIAIDPTTGKIIKQLYIGSDPGDFVFTTDFNYIFVGFDGEPVVRKINLSTFTIDQEINLGINPTDGPYYAKNLAVVKDNDSVFIVERYIKNSYPDYAGIAAYSNGKKLPNEPNSDNYYFDEISEILSTNSNTLYGYDNSSYDFYIMNFTTDSGLTVLKKQSYYNCFSDAKYDNGLIYSINGSVINPNILSKNSKIDISSEADIFDAVEPDYLNNKVFFIKAGDAYNRLLNYYSYNASTYKKIEKFTIKNVFSDGITMPKVSQLIRFGGNGLAARIWDSYSYKGCYSSIVVLNNFSFVNPNAPEDTSGLAKSFVSDTIVIHKKTYDTIPYKYSVKIYDTTHIAVTDTLILFSKNTRINGHYIFSNVKLYNNLPSKTINIDIENKNEFSKYKFQILNSTSQIKYDTMLDTALKEIDISSYPIGLYTIKVMNPQQYLVLVKYLVIK